MWHPLDDSKDSLQGAHEVVVPGGGIGVAGFEIRGVVVSSLLATRVSTTTVILIATRRTVASGLDHTPSGRSTVARDQSSRILSLGLHGRVSATAAGLGAHHQVGRFRRVGR